MKDTLLNEFYKLLENEINDVCVNSLKQWIESDELN